MSNVINLVDEDLEAQLHPQLKASVFNSTEIQERLDEIKKLYFPWEINDHIVGKQKQSLDNIVAAILESLENKQSVDWENIENWINDGSFPVPDTKIHGRSIHGNLVIYIRPSNVDDEIEFFRNRSLFMCRLIKKANAIRHARSRDTFCRKLIAIYDIQDVSIPSVVRKFASLEPIIKFYDSILRDGARKVIVINSGWTFYLVWNLFKRLPWVSQRSINKFSIVNGDYNEELLKEIPGDQIPKEYNGSATINETDPHIFLNEELPESIFDCTRTWTANMVERLAFPKDSLLQSEKFADSSGKSLIASEDSNEEYESWHLCDDVIEEPDFSDEESESGLLETFAEDVVTICSEQISDFIGAVENSEISRCVSDWTEEMLHIFETYSF